MIIPISKEKCENEIKYEIGSKTKRGAIPEGLDPQILIGTTHLTIQTLPFATENIEFYVHVRATGT